MFSAPVGGSDKAYNKDRLLSIPRDDAFRLEGVGFVTSAISEAASSSSPRSGELRESLAIQADLLLSVPASTSRRVVWLL